MQDQESMLCKYGVAKGEVADLEVLVVSTLE